MRGEVGMKLSEAVTDKDVISLMSMKKEALYFPPSISLVGHLRQND